jgi:hypothetical protein
VADDAYALTEDDVSILKSVVNFVRKSQGRTLNRPAPPPDLGDTPEFFVALTPAGGIPALTHPGTGTGAKDGDIPGSAECVVHRLISLSPSNPTNENLQPFVGGSGSNLGLAKTVYNLTNSTIVADTWITVAKDKLGRWWATTGAGTGGGGGTIPDWSYTVSGQGNLADQHCGKGRKYFQKSGIDPTGNNISYQTEDYAEGAAGTGGTSGATWTVAFTRTLGSGGTVLVGFGENEPYKIFIHASADTLAHHTGTSSLGINSDYIKANAAFVAGRSTGIGYPTPALSLVNPGQSLDFSGTAGVGYVMSSFTAFGEHGPGGAFFDSITPGNNQILLDWTGSTVEGASGYYIYRVRMYNDTGSPTYYYDGVIATITDPTQTQWTDNMDSPYYIRRNGNTSHLDATLQIHGLSTTSDLQNGILGSGAKISGPGMLTGIRPIVRFIIDANDIDTAAASLVSDFSGTYTFYNVGSASPNSSAPYPSGGNGTVGDQTPLSQIGWDYMYKGELLFKEGILVRAVNNSSTGTDTPRNTQDQWGQYAIKYGGQTKSFGDS